MNLVNKLSAIVAWSKDHSFNFSTKVLEAPPIFPSENAELAPKGGSELSPGLSLTISGKGDSKVSFWIPAHGSQEVWSVSLGGKVGIKAPLYDQHDLVDFLEKETSGILIAA